MAEEFTTIVVYTEGPEGAAGPAGAAGAAGATGAAGANAEMTRSSTTSTALVDTGAVTLVYSVAATNIGWQAGMRLRAASTANPTTVYMEGVITTVSNAQVTFTADYKNGAGTLADWKLGVVGDVGATGSVVGGAGLVLTGTTLDVGAGDGIQVDVDSVTAKLDGTTLAKGAAGLKVATQGITETQLHTSVAGNGLSGGNGSPLAIALGALPGNKGLEISADALAVKLEADAGLEFDGVNGGLEAKLDGSTLTKSATGLKVANDGITETQLNASVAGTGLTGGGGQPLAIGVGAGLTATANEVSVPTDGIVTAMILAEAVTAAKLAAAVAGAGLTGANGNPLAVGAGDGISVAADAVAVDVTVLRRDGSVAMTSSFNAGSQKIINLLDPTAAQDAATKAYVDATKQGLDPKDSVRAATTAALPANTRTGNVLTADVNGALAAQDGVTLIVNDRLLVKDEVTGANNGLFYVSAVGDAGNPWTLTRSTDADISAEVTSGLFVFVEEGTVNADSGWVLTTNNPITLNTTALNFTQFSGAGQITAGAGLTKTGNTLDVGAGDGIDANANDIAVDVTDFIDLTKGLGETTNNIEVKLESDGGLQFDGVNGGIEAKLDGSTLTVGANGLKVTDSTFAPLALADTKIFVGSAGGQAAAQTMSGDATLANTGALTLAADSVDASKLKDDAVTDANRAVTTNHIRDLAVTNAKVATGLDAVKIADGTVTNTEFQYVGGLTSDAQTQLNGKAPTAHSHGDAEILTGIDAVKIANGSVTNTEFQYLANATSDIQNQLDDKLLITTFRQRLLKDGLRVCTAAALPAYTRTSNTLDATANGALTIDGVAMALNDRFALKDGAAGADNGFYVVANAGSAGTPWSANRLADADNDTNEVLSGMFAYVSEGTANNKSIVYIETANPINVNTTALTLRVVKFDWLRTLTSDAQTQIDGKAASAHTHGNADILAGVDAVKIADGSVTNTEFQYIGTLTSNAQTQLDAKEATANKNAASGYAGLTAGTKLNLAQMQEVMALADLSDVAGETGSGNVVRTSSPTITAPTIAKLNAAVTQQHTINEHMAGITPDAGEAIFGNVKKQLTGTCETNGVSATITGTGTAFLTELKPGCSFRTGFDGLLWTIKSIESDTSATATATITTNQTGQTCHTDEDLFQCRAGDGNGNKRLTVDNGGNLKLPVGPSTDKAAVGSNLTVDSVAVGTDADLLEKTLKTVNIPVNALGRNGDMFLVEAWAMCAGNANTKTIKLKCGTTIAAQNNVTTAPNGKAVYCRMEVSRRAIDSQVVTGLCQVDVTNEQLSLQLLTENDGAAIALTLTGQNGVSSANDIMCQRFRVQFIPAP